MVQGISPMQKRVEDKKKVVVDISADHRITYSHIDLTAQEASTPIDLTAEEHSPEEDSDEENNVVVCLECTYENDDTSFECNMCSSELPGIGHFVRCRQCMYLHDVSNVVVLFVCKKCGASLLNN
jgi:ribosomal protein L40E